MSKIKLVLTFVLLLARKYALTYHGPLLFGLGCLNFGLFFILFGQLAKENQCSQHLISTFSGGGYVALFASGIIVSPILIHMMYTGLRILASAFRKKPKSLVHE